MVKEYLADPQVVLKNTSHETFANSLRVFVQNVQEPSQVSRSSEAWRNLCRTFDSLFEQFAKNKAEDQRLHETIKLREILTHLIFLFKHPSGIYVNRVSILRLPKLAWHGQCSPAQVLANVQ